MKTKAWLKKNTSSLLGKTVAVSGSTGGIGRSLCRYLAELGADLVLLDRSRERSEEHRRTLLSLREGISVSCITVELDDPDSVTNAAEALRNYPVDIFICNAGAYSIPRKICKSGYDNVFQINFVSPYMLINSLLPSLRERHGKVVVVGSIAHRYSVSDPADADFSTRKKASLVYGNSKRYLMFALSEKFRNETDVGLAVTHPGITFTNITAHYPKIIFALIKHPMKIIFPSTRVACLSILRGVFEDTAPDEWIGPSLFDVWGLPKKKRLRSLKKGEAEYFGKWSMSNVKKGVS